MNNAKKIYFFVVKQIAKKSFDFRKFSEMRVNVARVKRHVLAFDLCKIFEAQKKDP